MTFRSIDSLMAKYTPERLRKKREQEQDKAEALAEEPLRVSGNKPGQEGG